MSNAVLQNLLSELYPLHHFKVATLPSDKKYFYIVHRSYKGPFSNCLNFESIKQIDSTFHTILENFLKRFNICYVEKLDGFLIKGISRNQLAALIKVSGGLEIE